MVSKRKFFSIVIMMVVLLFLTQFSMVLRDQANQYDANASLSERKADGKEVIEQSEAERKDLSLLISEKKRAFYRRCFRCYGNGGKEMGGLCEVGYVFR